ncbi:MAG: TonB family protein [Acidobacteriota bacterium]
MKICPTCEKQFPNGFQYCPNDTELLLNAEEHLRRTQTMTPVAAQDLTQRLVKETRLEPIHPVAVHPALALPAPDLPATERLAETPTPFRQPEVRRAAEEPAVSQTSRTRQPEMAGSQEPVRQPPILQSRVTALASATGNGTSREAAATEKAEGGMSFILPEEGSIFSRLGEGFGQFFKYFGKKAPVNQAGAEGRFTIPEQAGLFAGVKDGFGQFVKYFGKSAPVGENEFLVPESGSIVKRLRESMTIFIDDFGKKTPAIKPGELGDFEFLLKDEPIYTRVGRELSGAAKEFRRDPRGFVASVLKGDGTTRRRQRLLQAGVATAMIAYAFIFTSFLLGGLFSFGKTTKPEEEKLELLGQLTAPPVDVKVADAPKETPRGKGGFTGGSKPKVEQAHGGGGGGREQVTPPSKGNPPQMALTPQIVMPNPEPPKIKNPSLPVASTVYGDPKALPELKGPIGDPQGAPAPPSSGPGTIAGIGRGAGTGVGPGGGGGAGPGNGGNAGGGDASFGGGRGPGGSGGILDMGRDGVGRIQILFKEKAKYTEEARQNKIQGTVVLSAVFTSDGQVTSVRVIRGLPDGLTEKAIEAAKKIRFQPATKNGAAVTVRGQLEFTFNLY